MNGWMKNLPAIWITKMSFWKYDTIECIIEFDHHFHTATITLYIKTCNLWYNTKRQANYAKLMKDNKKKWQINVDIRKRRKKHYLSSTWTLKRISFGRCLKAIDSCREQKKEKKFNVGTNEKTKTEWMNKLDLQSTDKR